MSGLDHRKQTNFLKGLLHQRPIAPAKNPKYNFSTRLDAQSMIYCRGKTTLLQNFGNCLSVCERGVILSYAFSTVIGRVL